MTESSSPRETERASPITRIVIADDEPLARQRIRSLLDDRRDIAIVGEARDGAEAVDLILRERPDVVFLDVKMPELDGFEVIAALEAMDDEPDASLLPAIIFVTAFGEFAVKAFEVRALDYLLKPFDRARLDRALDNAASRRTSRGRGEAASLLAPELRDLLTMLRAEEQRDQRFLIKNGARMYFVLAGDVEWADAAGNYVRLHANGRTHLYRDTMKGVEARLDSRRFVRIHRSAIVNIDRVAQIEPYVHGEYIVTMRDGTRLTSSRAHSAGLRALLER
jgi:two-component system, LytTR family, response regulator